MNFFEDIIQDFRISESGYGFLMNQNGNIIFHPQNMKQGREKGEIYRTRLEEYEDSNLVETINILRNKPNIIERINIVFLKRNGINLCIFAFIKVVFFKMQR